MEIEIVNKVIGICGNHYYAYDVEVKGYRENYNNVIFVTQEGASIHPNLSHLMDCLHGKLSFSEDSTFLYKEKSLSVLYELIRALQVDKNTYNYSISYLNDIIKEIIPEETMELKNNGYLKDELFILSSNLEKLKRNRDQFGYIKRGQR